MKNNIKHIVASIVFALMLTVLFHSCYSQSLKMESNKITVFEKWNFDTLSKAEDVNYIADSIDQLTYVNGVNVFQRKDNSTVVIKGDEIYLTGSYYRYFTIISSEILNGYQLYRVSGGEIEIHHKKAFIKVPGLDIVLHLKKVERPKRQRFNLLLALKSFNKSIKQQLSYR